MAKYCPVCGTSNGAEAKFCMKCGNPFDIAAPASAPQASFVTAPTPNPQAPFQVPPAPIPQSPFSAAPADGAAVPYVPDAEADYSLGDEVVAENLTLYWGVGPRRRTTTDHVSLRIDPGEFVGIIGGSGAGKSTLLNQLNGEWKPSEGRVLIGGYDLYAGRNHDAMIYSIGRVPQQEIIHENNSVENGLEAALKLSVAGISSEECRRRVDDVISMVGLEKERKSLVRNLSGGQKKRASIAMELLKDPQLLFLDEPDSGLDEYTASELMKKLKEMSRQGKTVVMVSHSLHSVSYCDRIIVLAKGGKLCYFGPPSRACAYFGVSSMGDIYGRIEEDPDTWVERWKANVRPEDLRSTYPVEEVPLVAPERPSFGKQVGVLALRYLRLIFNDRSRLLLLLAQAPLLALLIARFAATDCFVIYERTKSCMFSLACAAFWVGIFDSIQEICKERDIFDRENQGGVRVSAYVFSKVMMLGLLCVLQAALMTWVFVALVPETAEVAAPYGMVGIYVSLLLEMLSAMCLGLLVSSAFASPERAMAMAPLLIMPQLLFSGVVIELKGAVEVISTFVNCRWGMSALGSIANLNSLTLNAERTLGDSGLLDLDKLRPAIDATIYDSNPFNVFSAWAVLLLFSIVCVAGCLLVQWIRTKKSR